MSTLIDIFSPEDNFTVEFHKPGVSTVQLVAFTSYPSTVMAIAARGYKGIYSSEYPSLKEEDDLLEDISKTKLQTPLEMVHCLWLLKDVSRAFTHQLVRYRVGTAFIQESMRFLGIHNVYKVLVTGQVYRDENAWSQYKQSAISAIWSYHQMVLEGVPSQDARGVLPTNILTHIFFDCSMRTLQQIVPQRLCCQAQPGEWQIILKDMRKIINQTFGAEVEALLKAPYETGQDCGYRASFDRPCVWKNKDEK